MIATGVSADATAHRNTTLSRLPMTMYGLRRPQREAVKSDRARSGLHQQRGDHAGERDQPQAQP